MQIVRGLAYIISDGKASVSKMKASLPLVTPTGSVCLANLAHRRVSDHLWLAAE